MEGWEALDVDDSDLSAFLRPCKRHNSNSPTKSPQSQSQSQSQSQTLIPPDSGGSPPSLIPGPAGAVQAAMIHRRDRVHTSPEEPLPTQEFIRRVVQQGHESDHDFNSNAWRSAFHFLRSQSGMLLLDADSATPLNSISNLLNAGRVAQVIAVVKSCTPNGFGDMMVTLKDPTGTISASLHHKVFTEGAFGKDITVGSVLVLQKVAVFSPTPSTCYLNITSRNIVKVFSKDSGPPSEHIGPALSGRDTTPDLDRQQVSRMPCCSTFSLQQDGTKGIMPDRGLDSRSFATERHEKSRMLGNTFSLPQERTKGIMTNSRLDSEFLAKGRLGDSFSLPQDRAKVIITNLDSRFRVITDVDRQKGENLGVTSSDSDKGNDGNQKTVLETENLSLRQDNARPGEVSSDGEPEVDMNDQPIHPKLGEGDNLAHSSARGSTSTNSVHVSTGQDREVRNHLERQKEISNPVSSIPHWTEEQLDELLASD